MSNPWHMPIVLHYAAAMKPTRILDVGIGMGAYGFMLRQHLDIAYERLTRESWQLTIDGIEIFPPYRNPIWDFAYDAVHVGDATSLISGLGSYDLIVCNDVLEHLTAADARAFTKAMLGHASAVVATTPNSECPQGAWGGNLAETHRSVITASLLPSVVAQTDAPQTTCFAMSEDPLVASLLRRAHATCHRIAKPIASTLPYRAMQRVRRLTKKT